MSLIFGTAPTIPVTGAEVDAWVPVIITSFGATCLAVLGGYVAFMLLRKGMKWLRKIG